MSLASREKLLSELVGMIYDAAEDPRRWGVFLESFGAAFNAHIVQFEWSDPENFLVELFGMSPRDQQNLSDYYWTVNPWLGEIGDAKAGDAAPSHLVVPDFKYRETEYFRDYGRRIDQYYGMAGLIVKSASELGIIAVLRDRVAGPCSDEDADTLRLLVPHLARSLRLSSQFAYLKAESSILFEHLDRLAQGIVILDQLGRVVRANKMAEQIADKRDGIYLSAREGLQAHTSEESSMLRKMIFNAVDVAKGNAASPGGSLTVSRPLRRPWIVVVSPFRVSSRQGLAAVLLIDPERNPKPKATLISKLFGFTPAETKMAILLADGTCVEDAAAKLHITMNTARTHVKRMLDKSGLRRQTDLILLLNKIPGDA